MAAIFARTVILYLFLSVSMKLMGKRQIGELEVSELVCTLLISEIAAIPMQDPDLPLLGALIPICFILSAEILISSFKNRSTRLKSVIEGTPAYLIYRGRIRQNILKENRISVNELLAQIRLQGIGNLRDVDYCVLEANGKISVLERAQSKNAPTDDSTLAHSLIVDGEIDEKTLHALGYDHTWLKQQLKGERAENIFLMCVDDGGTTNIIRKEKNRK